MAKFIVVKPGYLNDKLWNVGETIESAEPLPPSTWYYLEGQKPLYEGQNLLRDAEIDPQRALMNKPSPVAAASAQDIAKLADKEREIAELKAKNAELEAKITEAKAEAEEEDEEAEGGRKGRGKK